MSRGQNSIKHLLKVVNWVINVKEQTSFSKILHFKEGIIWGSLFYNDLKKIVTEKDLNHEETFSGTVSFQTLSEFLVPSTEAWWASLMTL